MFCQSTWTRQRVETLTRLWRDGLSASQVARALGGVTRNAVIGKVHRLGLSGRAKPSAPGARRSAPKERRLRLPKRAASRALATAPGITAVGPPPMTGLATVSSVGRGQCRWPIGAPGADDFCLCGRPVQRGAYCAPHGALAYRAAPRDHLLKLARLG